jgi:hypothetical protein
MSMNQIPMGTPAGNSDLIGRLASFMTGSGKKSGGSSRSGDIHRMAAQHALESVRSDRKHGQELERMNVGHANTRELQATDLAHKANEGALSRLHEKETQVRGIRADAKTIAATHAHEQTLQSAQHAHEQVTQVATHGHVERTQAAEQAHGQMMENLQSGNRISELRESFRGIHSLGRAGHTASFNIGSTGASFHPPVPTQAHSETPNNPDGKIPGSSAAAAPAAPTPPEPPKNTKAYVVKHPVTGKLMANPDRIKETPAAPEAPAAPRTRKPKK